MDLIGRKPTLLFVAVLCVGQFVWTCYTERGALGAPGMVAALVAVALALLGFERLRSWGAVLVGEAENKAARKAPDGRNVAAKSIPAEAVNMDN